MGWVGVLTDTGKQALVTLAQGGHTLTITKATVGSGYKSSESEMRSATALTTYKADASITNKNVTNDAVLRVRVLITAAATGYTAHEIGVWAKLDTGSEFLLSYQQDSDTGIEIPASSVTPDFAFSLYCALVVGNTSAVTVTLDTSALVSQGTLDSELEGKVNTSDVIDITHGGTGATSTSDALEALGAAGTSEATNSTKGLMSAADKSKLDGIESGANAYVHPSPGAVSTSGHPMADQTPNHGEYFNVSQVGIDSNGHVKSLTTRKITLPAQYTHPSHTARSSGLYKVTVDALGHVSAAAAVAKSDITALGIPAQDTTYSPATTSANGLMSSTDKNAFDNETVRQKARPSAYTSLDQFVSPGMYYVSTAAVANGWPHTGTIGASLLEVLKAAGNSSNVVVYVQRLIANANSDSPELWFRTKYGTADWREWQPISSGYTPV